MVERKLGSGGFGTVYRAWDERLGRPVAVKVVEQSRVPADRAAREAQAAARLSHRAIATLYEMASDGEHVFLVGELVDGETLSALAHNGRLSDQIVAQIGTEAAAALTHAHRHGVVHRDIKPQNIMVPADTSMAKLVDFGVARVGNQPTMTRTGAVIGTLAYMAPEQADGLRAGPAADVYSLALTLYECWAGFHPVVREGPAATARAIGGEVDSLGAMRPDLPAGLTDVIDSALDPDADLRPLASELEEVLAWHIPLLDTTLLPATSPRNDEQSAPGGLSGTSNSELEPLAGAMALSALTAGALFAVGATGAALVLAPAAGLAALHRPRPAAVGAVVGCAAWIGVVSGQPGAAIALLVLCLPMLATLGRAPRGALLPPFATVLGLVSLAPVYPVLAAIPRQPVARAILGAAGYLWLVAAEAALRRDLFLGAPDPAPGGWGRSADAALSTVLAPLASPSVIAVCLIWALAAVVLPTLVRGRVALIDLIGATIWGAGVVALTRAVTGAGGQGAARLGIAVVIAVAVAVASAQVVRRQGFRQASHSPGDGSHLGFSA